MTIEIVDYRLVCIICSFYDDPIVIHVNYLQQSTSISLGNEPLGFGICCMPSPIIYDLLWPSVFETLPDFIFRDIVILIE